MRVVIIGGGVIGLAIAWRSLTSGLEVTVVDEQPGSGASHVSAGLLPAANEMLKDQGDLLRLCLASRDRYRAFAAELEQASGLPSSYRGDGQLDVATTDADLAALNRLRRFEEGLGIDVEPLTGDQCRDCEPALAGTVRGGLMHPADGSVNPRRLTAALLAAINRLGGTLLRRRVADVVVDGRATGVRLADGEIVNGDQIVLAAGCWTHQIGGLPPGTVPEIRPVKGEILRLCSDPPFLRHAVRGLVGGRALYLVPRLDGELVIGATYEERGYDITVTAGGLAQLLDIARELLPGVTGLTVTEFSAGLRPGSPDGLPVLGLTAVPGLLLATGHSRIGVQLTPVTADAITEALITSELPEVARPFTAERFSGSARRG